MEKFKSRRFIRVLSLLASLATATPHPPPICRNSAINCACRKGYKVIALALSAVHSKPAGRLSDNSVKPWYDRYASDLIPQSRLGPGKVELEATVTVTMTDTPEDVHHRLWHVLTPGIPREQSQELYRTWAPLYEQDMKTSHYNGPRQVAETLVKALGSRSDAHILDVAAGTGFVGEELQKLGFSNLDALDASQEMLDIARTKQVYNNFILDFLGTNRLNIEDDTYNATSCCGAFCEGHVKCDCLEELIRVVKPGGYVCVGIRKFFLETVEEYHKLEPLMADLQHRGLWEPISRKVTQDYCEGYDGVVFLFKVK